MSDNGEEKGVWDGLSEILRGWGEFNRGLVQPGHRNLHRYKFRCGEVSKGPPRRLMRLKIILKSIEEGLKQKTRQNVVVLDWGSRSNAALGNLV